METDEMVFHAAPQTQGKIAHETIDRKKASNRADDIISMSVYSDEYGLMGKIDIYKRNEQKLIERKFQLKHIFQGQVYQLWAQMLCLNEMGYEVKALEFYETSRNKSIPVPIPSKADIDLFKSFLQEFRSFDPGNTPFSININKCNHCIYCNLCDKTNKDNVYI